MLFKVSFILEPLSISVVSNDWSHNQSEVPAFLASDLSFVKTKLSFVKKVVYFSDDAASQFKNYKAFINLCFNH